MNEQIIARYAKKIYGYAYGKTRNCHDAEDLSQEIVLSLCSISPSEKPIDNMDAYIYRICQYTWSKYLRKNKPFWECMGTMDCLDAIISGQNVEDDADRREILDKLRQEILYLGKTRREVIILYYYEGKSGEDISSLLHIPASTVRWHLHRTKHDLKERIDMYSQPVVYRPVKLSIGHYGCYENDILRQLESDILMQNICWICFEKPMALEDISRTLGVATVYLEDKLEKLVYMEYMVKSPKGQYRTNFFIRTAPYLLEHSRYQYEKTLPLAMQYFEVIQAAMPDIKKIGFSGVTDDNVLMCDILMYFLAKEIAAADERMIKKLGLEHSAPIRPDGTRHWVRASASGENRQKAADKGLEEYIGKAGSFGLKSNHISSDKLRSLQLDSRFLSDERTFSTHDMLGIKRLADLQKSGEEANSYDKAMIAALIEKGYVSRTNEGFSLRVPYCNAEEIREIDRILDLYAAQILDHRENDALFIGYAEHMKKFIPSFVSKNERDHTITSYDPYNAVFWLLMKNGCLEKPEETQRAYICTLLWDAEG